MGALKKFAVGILSLFLFLSLSVFGYLFTLNRTALNPNFIVTELGKLDVTMLVNNREWVFPDVHPQYTIGWVNAFSS